MAVRYSFGVMLLKISIHSCAAPALVTCGIDYTVSAKSVAQGCRFTYRCTGCMRETSCQNLVGNLGVN
eukprot:2320388-Rhodomonas_salina.2